MLVKIKFESSKLFVNYSVGKGIRVKDNVIVNNGKLFRTYRDRKENDIIPVKNGVIGADNFNLIDINQVSNMLHVLFGCRPVSTYHNIYIEGVDGVRRPLHERLKEIDEIAKNGYYKIVNTPYVEFSRGEKNNLADSSNSTHITFKKLKTHMLEYYGTTDMYYKFLQILSEYTSKNVCKENYSSVDNAILELSEDKKTEFKKNLKQNGFRTESVYVNETFSRLHFYKGVATNSLSSYCTNSTICKSVELYGSFIFEVDNNMYNILVNGKKFATFLDGGVAKLCKWDELGYNTYGIQRGELIEYNILNDMGYSKIVK